MVSGGLLRMTDASRATPEAVFDSVAAQTPQGRVTTPEDLADAVLFFASPWARAVTGQNLVVDGGLVFGGSRAATGWTQGGEGQAWPLRFLAVGVLLHLREDDRTAVDVAGGFGLASARLQEGCSPERPLMTWHEGPAIGQCRPALRPHPPAAAFGDRCAERLIAVVG